MKPKYAPRARSMMLELVNLISAAERNGEDMREIQRVLLLYTSVMGLRQDQSLDECLQHAQVGIRMAERAANEQEALEGINSAELFTRKAHLFLLALKAGL